MIIQVMILLISAVKHFLLLLVTRLKRGIKGYGNIVFRITLYNPFSYVSRETIFEKVIILLISAVKHFLLLASEKVKRVIQGYGDIVFLVTLYNPFSLKSNHWKKAIAAQ